MALTQDQKLEGVRALLNPKSVAIVGASDRPGNWSLRVFQTLRRFSFPGPIYPVNPRNKTVWDGETCYPSLSDLPQAPDHVVVIVPGAAAIDTIAEAGRVKARSATVFSGGFGEGGDAQGRELAVRLRQAIDDGQVSWSLEQMKQVPADPNGFSDFERELLRDLQQLRKLQLRVLSRIDRTGDDAKLTHRAFLAEAHLAVSDLLTERDSFFQKLRCFYDRIGQTKCDVPDASGGDVSA